MAAVTPKLRSIGKIHGGKSYLARRIVALMPQHDRYVEACCGMASVLLNKPPAKVEIACDTNQEIVNLWRLVQSSPKRLQLDMAATPYSKESFEAACRYLEDPYPWDENRLTFSWLVRNRMSRGGLGKDFSASTRERGGREEGANSWETIRSMVPAISERIAKVSFRAHPVLNTLKLYDVPDTLIYVDPPYLRDTRSHKTTYGPHEMSRADHLRLLAELVSIDFAKVMLSGYANPIYEHSLVGWRRVQWEMPNHSGQGRTKNRRVECLWMNF